MNKKVTLVNQTNFLDKDIMKIVDDLLEGQKFPSFYLICQSNKCNGLALSNLDKPTIVTFIEDLKQFTKIFTHEFTHIQQHSKNYADENEAYQRELIVTQ